MGKGSKKNKKAMTPVSNNENKQNLIEEMKKEQLGPNIIEDKAQKQIEKLNSTISELQKELSEVIKRKNELEAEQTDIKKRGKDLDELESKLAENEKKQNNTKAEIGEQLKEIKKQTDALSKESKRLIEKDKKITAREEEARLGFVKENEANWEEFYNKIEDLKDQIDGRINLLNEQQIKALQGEEEILKDISDKYDEYKEKIKEVFNSKYNLEVQNLELQREQYNELVQKCNDKCKEYIEKKNEFDIKQIAFEKEKEDLRQKKVELEYNQQNWEDSLKNIEIQKKEEYEFILKNTKEIYQKRIAELSEELKEYKTLEVKLEDEHDLTDIKSVKKLAKEAYLLREKVKNLENKLVNIPSGYEIDEIESNRELIDSLNDKLREKSNEVARLRKIELQKNSDVEIVDRLNRELERYRRMYDIAIKTTEEEINKLKNLHGDKTTEITRLSSVNIPYFDIEDEYEEPEDNEDILDEDGNVSEIKWLDEISSKCEKSGYTFDKRLLYAFHTSLKIADWSPLTVLAGISGTGKSSLPRLYSRFGGFYFLMVPVQPDWDSPQSIFGYFNSIDNKFNATSLLQVMVQGSAAIENNLQDKMIMVLLDEMNLAHVELYFSDMLSKLEDRRDKGPDESTCIEIDVGAGMSKHQIELTKNIFYIGTMNEDETTKSLSDKVIDRGNIITFPAPKTFTSRTKINMEEESGKLSYDTWNEWLDSRVEFGKEVEKYKKSLEKINRILGHLRRQLGNRVWQSVENYMANHPLVIKYRNNENKYAEAMKLAFEDAMVHKVMPKLRGIELEGESMEKLKEIGTELTTIAPGIKEDYEIACKNPYGVFVWSSAEYLNNFMELDNDGE